MKRDRGIAVGLVEGIVDEELEELHGGLDAVVQDEHVDLFVVRDGTVVYGDPDFVAAIGRFGDDFQHVGIGWGSLLRDFRGVYPAGH